MWALSCRIGMKYVIVGARLECSPLLRIKVNDAPHGYGSREQKLVEKLRFVASSKRYFAYFCGEM